mmetsp:Transcript_9017/g.19619  ORF Transcript_9017/g.19619 Transcript_9017/m.19619 type:complete len:140 (-) Transcript_9017:189-608(-)
MSPSGFKSTYEELVLTKDHPSKVQFQNVAPPDYIAASRLGAFWATRREELMICLFVAVVALYCSGVYTALYASFCLPALSILRYGWDIVVLSIAATSLLQRRLRKRVRKVAFALTLLVSLTRWYRPELYPSWYPWQLTR